ncbi:MAG: TIGR02597 family protein [Candidatus Liptonbacteria bacterium]|nr:TIGR02597 family protein [Candidatus Liptonbacteria bacterium]
MTPTAVTPIGLKTQFASVAGKEYRLERNPNFPSGSWQTSFDKVPGTGTHLEAIDTVAPSLTTSIHRLRVLGNGHPDVLSKLSGSFNQRLFGNSETRVSIPFARPDAAAGLVVSVANNVVTIKGAPAWTLGQWVFASDTQTNTYYLSIRSGAKEGFFYKITDNTENSLTLDLQDETLDGLNALDRVAVVPFWTLGTIFPGGIGVHASTSQFTRRTEVFLFSGTGINLSAARTYFFMGNWRQYGVTGNKDDDILWPDTYFIVRHNLSTDTSLTCFGDVISSKWAIRLRSRSAGRQDNPVALPRPAAQSLNQSGLVESGAIRPSMSRFQRADELLVFDNQAIGKNKSASATYFFFAGRWEKYGESQRDAGDDLIFAPGTGVIIRRNSSTEPGALTPA